MSHSKSFIAQLLTATARSTLEGDLSQGATARGNAGHNLSLLLAAVGRTTPAFNPAAETRSDARPGTVSLGQQTRQAPLDHPNDAYVDDTVTFDLGNPSTRQRGSYRSALGVVVATFAVLAVVGLTLTIKSVIHSPQQGWTSPPPGLTPSPPADLVTLASQGVDAVAFSFDGGYLAAGNSNGVVRAWRVGTWTVDASMTDPGSRGVSSVAFNPANSLLAAGDANGHVYLWGRDQLKETLSDSSGSPIRSVAFSLDNQYLAAGDGRGNVDVWRISTWQRVATMSDPNSGGVNSVAFSSAGLLAAGDANGHVYLWSSDHATTLTDPSGSSVRSVVFTKNSNSLIGGDSSGHVYIWQSATGKVTESFIDPDSRGVESVAYNSDSTVIAAGDGNGQVYLWLNKLQSTIQNPTSDPALSVTYSPNNRYLAIAAASGHVYVRSTTP